MRLWRYVGAVLSAAAILGGCGSGEPSSGTKAQGAKKISAPADELARTLVSAVPAAKGASFPVQVKFHLRNRPDVGQPVSIDLVLQPTTASIDRITGKIVAEEGLELIEGSDIGPIDRPSGSAAISHTVKVLPKRDGIFTFSAILTVDSGGHSTSQAFLMPLIAGAGMPESPASPAKPVPATAAAQ